MAGPILTQPLGMPQPEQPLMNQDGRVSQVWWRFWQGLYTRTTSSLTVSVATGLTAAGATQATALALTSQLNQVSTVALNTGVRVSALGVGLASIVWNDGANPLGVYPPAGSVIDALGTNAAYALATGKSQVFYQLTSSLFRTLQLG